MPHFINLDWLDRCIYLVNEMVLSFVKYFDIKNKQQNSIQNLILKNTNIYDQ